VSTDTVRAPAATGFAFHSAVRQVAADRWRVIDSGANQHFTSDEGLFTTSRVPSSVRVKGISGEMRVTGVGRGRIYVAGVAIDLPRLHFIPGLATTLISMSELVEEGCAICTQKVKGLHEMRITNSAHAVTSHRLTLPPNITLPPRRLPAHTHATAHSLLCLVSTSAELTLVPSR
jgi:hypothetical protein